MRRRDEAKICGTCRHHYKSKLTGEYACTNGESAYCTDYTDYECTCEDWERRKDKK